MVGSPKSRRNGVAGGGGTRPVQPPELPSVLWPIFKTYRYSFLAGALLKFVFDLLQFVSPELLR